MKIFTAVFRILHLPTGCMITTEWNAMSSKWQRDKTNSWSTRSTGAHTKKSFDGAFCAKIPRSRISEVLSSWFSRRHGTSHHRENLETKQTQPHFFALRYKISMDNCSKHVVDTQSSQQFSISNILLKIKRQRLDKCRVGQNAFNRNSFGGFEPQRFQRDKTVNE